MAIFWSLVHDDPTLFKISQWQEKEKNWLHIVYRWIVALLFVVTLIISVMDLDNPDSNKIKWLIYWTNWSYAISTFQFVLAVLIVSNLVEVTNYYKLYWFLNQIATDVAFAVTIVYWGWYQRVLNTPLTVIGFFLHVSNSLFMLVDLMIVAHPVKLKHFFFSVLFVVCYAIFTFLYFCAGGTNKNGDSFIYSILDWNTPRRGVVICFGVFALTGGLHCFSWSIYKIRVWLHKSFFKKYKIVNTDNVNLSYK